LQRNAEIYGHRTKEVYIRRMLPKYGGYRLTGQLLRIPTRTSGLGKSRQRVSPNTPWTPERLRASASSAEAPTCDAPSGVIQGCAA
jgi:hypothetical protein